MSDTERDHRGDVGRRNQPSIALALGGGGARGIAHILILEAFDELGLRPSIITGTSIGAIYGGAYAAGLSAARIRAQTEEILTLRFDLVRQLLAARAEPVQRWLNLLPIRTALLNPATLLDLILPSEVNGAFSDLVIPFSAVATDFHGQEVAVISSGPVRPAIAASMALPALFQPVVIEGRPLIDGGLVNPLPFDVVAGKADVTIAIDVSGASHKAHADTSPTAYEALISTTQILQRSIVREKLKSARPDIYIDVDVDPFNILEFHRVKEILLAAEPAKATLKRKLADLMGLDPDLNVLRAGRQKPSDAGAKAGVTRPKKLPPARKKPGRRED